MNIFEALLSIWQGMGIWYCGSLFALGLLMATHEEEKYPWWVYLFILSSWLVVGVIIGDYFIKRKP